jgi:hypothetical protein
LQAAGAAAAPCKWQEQLLSFKNVHPMKANGLIDENETPKSWQQQKYEDDGFV